MVSLLKRFGFAGVVLALVVLAVVAVVGKAVLDGADAPAGQTANAGAPPSGSKTDGPKAGGPKGDGAKAGGGGGGGSARVILETLALAPFYDAVPALGTAQARESITITSKVSEVIEQIRFDSGDRVRRGQVLVVLSSSEQRADLAEAQAQLEAAKRDNERFAELGVQGFAPASRVEATRAAFDRAQARVAALQARMADRVIRAPFAGVMGLRTASPGALARPGDPIGTLDDVSVIKLDFDVPESQIAMVKPGATIEARSAASPGRVFAGRVEDIDSRLNTTTRTMRARAILPNPDGALKPGMLMTVNVRYNPRSAVSVPEVALLERSDGLYVFRADTVDGKLVASLAPVRVSRRVSGRAEVTEGLKAGDQIVVEGVQRVRPGQPLQPIQAERLSAPAAAAAPAKTSSAPGPSPRASQ